MLPLAERIGRAVWARHYQIPEVVYWLVLVVAAILTPLFSQSGKQYVTGIAIMLFAIVGIGRWHRDRSRCRGTVVVPLFREGGGALSAKLG